MFVTNIFIAQLIQSSLQKKTSFTVLKQSLQEIELLTKSYMNIVNFDGYCDYKDQYVPEIAMKKCLQILKSGNQNQQYLQKIYDILTEESSAAYKINMMNQQVK